MVPELWRDRPISRLIEIGARILITYQMNKIRTFRTALTALVAFVTKTWGGKASKWDNLKESISFLTISAVEVVNVQHKLKISMLRDNYDLQRLQSSSWLAKILQDLHDRLQSYKKRDHDHWQKSCKILMIGKNLTRSSWSAPTKSATWPTAFLWSGSRSDRNHLSFRVGDSTDCIFKSGDFGSQHN